MIGKLAHIYYSQAAWKQKKYDEDDAVLKKKPKIEQEDYWLPQKDEIEFAEAEIMGIYYDSDMEDACICFRVRSGFLESRRMTLVRIL